MRKNLIGTRPTRAAVFVLSAALALTMSACGQDSTVSPGANSASETGAGAVSETKNKADVAFIQGMTPHHQGAIMMTELAVDRAENPKVKALAERISAAQDPEIALMKQMAQTWGVELSDGMSMSAGGGPMTMMDMSALESKSGPAFDKAFLEEMIPHHENALPSSRTEIEQGANPQAKALAENIIKSQTAEIEEMKQLLTEL
ncbi:MAG: DUF305 domain-containing protein [Mycobacteriales bacterium]